MEEIDPHRAGLEASLRSVGERDAELRWTGYRAQLPRQLRGNDRVRRTRVHQKSRLGATASKNPGLYIDMPHPSSVPRSPDAYQRELPGRTPHLVEMKQIEFHDMAT